VIKTHLGAADCPFSPEARYVYVARHPVSCFASCVDFLAQNAGAAAPATDAVERWFCSETDMWWGPWPDHVAGWWELASEHDQVLFIRFEDMKHDLEGVARRVADFLDLGPLTDGEAARIVEKCGFEYMRAHRGTFEMHPPHLLATDADLLLRGSADRHHDVPEDIRARVGSWCSERLAALDGPVHLYGDAGRERS
jgi:hypothetical protein